MTNVLFGYHMPSFQPGGQANGLDFGQIKTWAQSAEAAGFDIITVMDHFHQTGRREPEAGDMLEAYTTLGALAAVTSRVLVGCLVTSVTHRNPAVLAKTVTTLDTISGGRAILGIGAGWHANEHRAYGIPFPPIGERLDRLEEALEICRRMFTETRPTFRGVFYEIDEALNVPRPRRAGGPPVLVGGVGERRTLQLVARYADMAHWSVTLEAARHKLDVLKRHCAAEGRDIATIRIVAHSPVSVGGMSIDEAADTLHTWLAAGVSGFTFRSPDLHTPEQFAAAAELIALAR